MGRGWVLFPWLALLLGMGGCRLSSPPWGVLEGYVQAGPSQTPIAGAVVRFSSDRHTDAVQTDPRGFYRIPLPVGTYTAEVVRDGYAASRVEGVPVGTLHRLDLVALPPFYAGWPKVAPNVAAEGLSPGNLVHPGQAVRFRAEGPLPMQWLLLRTGAIPSLPFAAPGQLVWERSGDTGWFALPEPLLRGPWEETFLHVVAYDVNNNRTHRLIPIRTPPFLPASTLSAPQLQAAAFTLGQSLRTLGLAEHPPALFVHLSWEPRPESMGYRLYRDGFLLGEYPPSVTEAYDQGADLQPGQPACYTLETLALNVRSLAQSCTTPLPAFTVRLVSPTGEASPSPTFQVDFSPQVGGALRLRLALYDTFTGGSVQLFPPVPTDQANLPWTGPSLVPGRTYAWGVYLAYAVDDPSNPRAYSVAVDQGGNLLGQVLPGPIATFEVRP